jgi:hypothetical protein
MAGPKYIGNAAYLRQLRAEAKARGDCSTCRARPARIGKLTCQECVDRTRATEQRRHDAGLCEKCGKPAKGWKCLPCGRAIRERYEARKKADGKCVRSGCHWPAAPGHVHCHVCLERQRLAALARKRRDQGDVEVQRCTLCRDPGHNRTSCSVATNRLVEVAR